MVTAEQHMKEDRTEIYTRASQETVIMKLDVQGREGGQLKIRDQVSLVVRADITFHREVSIEVSGDGCFPTIGALAIAQNTDGIHTHVGVPAEHFETSNFLSASNADK